MKILLEVCLEVNVGGEWGKGRQELKKDDLIFKAKSLQFESYLNIWDKCPDFHSKSNIQTLYSIYKL